MCSADAASSHEADDGSQRTDTDDGCRLRMMPATDDADDGSRRPKPTTGADDGCRRPTLTTDAGHGLQATMRSTPQNKWMQQTRSAPWPAGGAALAADPCVLRTLRRRTTPTTEANGRMSTTDTDNGRWRPPMMPTTDVDDGCRLRTPTTDAHDGCSRRTTGYDAFDAAEQVDAADEVRAIASRRRGPRS